MTELKRNAEYDPSATCPTNCPKRKVGCHNAETCERWAEHEKRKAEAYKKRKTKSLATINHRKHKK